MMKPLLLSLCLITAVNAETLESQLAKRKQDFAAKADNYTKLAYAAGIRSVVDSGILNRAIKARQKAPDFSLKNAKGEVVTLSTLLKDGPVVLTWYRGGWCPYCNLTLAALQKALPELQATRHCLSPPPTSSTAAEWCAMHLSMPTTATAPNQQSL